MSEKPTLFSGAMVRAIINGTKTQTRRIVKPEPVLDSSLISGPTGVVDGKEVGVVRRNHLIWPAKHGCHTDFHQGIRWIENRCPYGQPSDRIWVRENGWEPPLITSKMLREGADTWPKYAYDADDIDHAFYKEMGWKRRPSIHMPRWASRLTLEIVSVRVERLQNISTDDAEAEGAIRWWNEQPTPREIVHPKRAYQNLWESINGEGSWAANPWVWVVEFRKV